MLSDKALALLNDPLPQLYFWRRHIEPFQATEIAVFIFLNEGVTALTNNYTGEPADFQFQSGQQQRLCLARTLALEPEVILLDEPTSGLDPISTVKVEDSLQELKNQYTIIIVPHSIQQGIRVADYAAFLLSGELVESGPAKDFFDHPTDQRIEGVL